MDFKLELVCIPVGDVDSAKAFYVDKVGFVADHDQRVNSTLRFVQLTPPGSGCSICIGDGLTAMTPGTLEGLQLVVDDVEQARAEFAERGLDVGEVEELPWGRFIYFADPDGNKWSVQQILPAG
ncbi:glyoxalase superfamily protein [uncultured Jatrophihabitans sp.]|uniref:glyoxalase superfamily protein n=1 Tax=uncultured Jatrophihabitans sp. TaxID=1610747 RepID=UPI0035C9527D